MALADVLQLIQQQQAFEYQKEKDAQALAFNILQIDQRKADRAQEILLKEYYSKKAEVSKTEDMFDKYSNLSPSDVSPGGRDIISIVDKQNNIDMEAITSNLDALGSYQSQLESSLGELKGQAQTLKELQTEFAGANRVLQPHEYEAFQEHALTALEEGGLGWSTTAGADVEYFKTDPEAKFARAYTITEKMKSDHEKVGSGDYTIFQASIQREEGEDLEDLAERLRYEDAEGKEQIPSEKVLGLLENMAKQTNFEDFVLGVETYPSDLGGEELRAEIAANPNLARLYTNVQTRSDAIRTLDIELAGINETPAETNLEQFVSDISGVTNQKALFGLYDQAIEGLDPEEHTPFFNAMELQAGVSDLYPAYGEFKGFSSGGTVETDRAIDSLNQLNDKQIKAQELERKQNILWESGLVGTAIYEDLTDSLTALNREIRTAQEYQDYRAELDRKLLQGKLSEEDLNELSSALNMPAEDLEIIIEEKRQQAAIRRQPPGRPAYERGLLE